MIPTHRPISGDEATPMTASNAIIADTWPKYEHHKDAAFNAALLRTTVGEHDKAIASGDTFRRLYPRDPLAALREE